MLIVDAGDKPSLHLESIIGGTTSSYRIMTRLASCRTMRALAAIAVAALFLSPLEVLAVQHVQRALDPGTFTPCVKSA
jgi:hypothetical protein